jgi:hypothetical protein
MKDTLIKILQEDILNFKNLKKVDPGASEYARGRIEERGPYRSVK